MLEKEISRATKEEVVRSCLAEMNEMRSSYFKLVSQAIIDKVRFDPVRLKDVD